MSERLSSFLSCEPDPDAAHSMHMRSLQHLRATEIQTDFEMGSIWRSLQVAYNQGLWAWNMPPIYSLVEARTMLSSEEAYECGYPGLIAFGEGAQYGSFPDWRLWIGRTALVGRSVILGMTSRGLPQFFHPIEAEKLMEVIGLNQQTWEMVFNAETPAIPPLH